MPGTHSFSDLRSTQALELCLLDFCYSIPGLHFVRRITPKCFDVTVKRTGLGGVHRELCALPQASLSSLHIHKVSKGKNARTSLLFSSKLHSGD